MTRIYRQAYERLPLQHEAGRHKWVSNVKTILVENGFGIVWLCQSENLLAQYENLERHKLLQD